MLRTENRYCSNCLATQRFLDLGAILVCERCSKRLERSVKTPDSASAYAQSNGPPNGSPNGSPNGPARPGDGETVWEHRPAA